MKKTICEFVKDKLEDGRTLSDCQIIDNYWWKYMLFWNYASIAKKWESIRKELWEMKKKGILKEVNRIRHWYSDEIFYKIIK